MRHLVTLLVMGCVCCVSNAQQSRPITVHEFIDVILDHPDIKSSEEKILKSDYDIEVSKLMPSPSLTMGNASGDISGMRMPQQFYVGVDYTIETGGKRKHRLAYARASKELLRAEHDVFVNEFLRSSLLSYHKCWMMKQQFSEISAFDSLLNWTTEEDATALEMMRIENALRQAEFETQYVNALEEFQNLVSHRFEEFEVVPSQPVWDQFATSQTVPLDNQPLLSLVKAEQKVKQEEVLLEEANMAGDISFTIGNNFITEGTNPEAPSPSYNAITATVSVPLRFGKVGNNSKKVANGTPTDPDEKEVAMLQEIESRLIATRKENERLIKQLDQIQTLIALEMKRIRKCSKESEMVVELKKLQSLQQMRWDKMAQLSINQSVLNGGSFMMDAKLARSNAKQ